MRGGANIGDRPSSPLRRPRGFAGSAIALVAVLALATFPAASSRSAEPAQISARTIEQFRVGRDETRFGPLEFNGGLELTSSSRDFGAFSALRFLSPGRDFVGIADTGFWFFGAVARDPEGRPSGISQFRIEPMVDPAGRPISEKWLVDAEGMAVRDGVATVGFERDHRIERFHIDPGGMDAATGALDFLVPARELRQNRGFETVAHAPASGPLAGAMVVVSEKSLDKSGNIFAAVLEGPRKGIFTVRRNGNFDITDGAFLPDGDLLLLERSYNMAQGVAMRLRRIAASTIEKGAVADGPVLLDADMSYQIDNMEGLDVWLRADGATMVSLVSDDNHSMLQRNLYLEFILHGD